MEELSLLRAEIAALQQELASVHEQNKQLANESQTFRGLVENAPDAISLVDMQGRTTYANAAHKYLSGYGDAAEGMPYTAFFFPEDTAQIDRAGHQAFEQGLWVGPLRWRHREGHGLPIYVSLFLRRDQRGAALGYAMITRDMTAQAQAERERLELREQIIEAQDATLRELSTPLIPLADEVVAMPLIGSIDTRRAQQIVETLLEGVASQRASMAIIDITGVPIVDTQVASALLRAAQAVKLLGAKVVLTGIRPEVAQTLVGLGLDLSGIVTLASLQSGIAYALNTHQRRVR